MQRGERIAIYLEKRFETVIASFGAPAAGWTLSWHSMLPQRARKIVL